MNECVSDWTNSGYHHLIMFILPHNLQKILKKYIQHPWVDPSVWSACFLYRNATRCSPAPLQLCLSKTLTVTGLLREPTWGKTKESAFSSWVPDPGYRSRCSSSTLKWEAGTQDSGFPIHRLPFTVTATVVVKGDI